MSAKARAAVGFGSASSVKRTADRLETSIPTIYKLIHAGELESFKIGKYRKILDRSTDALIARQLAAEAKATAA
jgi:excisionase family DNA binding protein